MTKTRQLGIERMTRDLTNRARSLPMPVAQNEEVAQVLRRKKLRKDMKGPRVKPHHRERNYK